MRPAPQPTEAERALATLFETRSTQFSDAPLDAARAGAFARFASVGLPHRRVEAYRYTDLKARLRALPPAAEPASEEAIDAALADKPPLRDGVARVVIANGRLAQADAMPEGVTVASLLDPATQTSDVGALIAESDDPLTLAAAGLFDGGAVVRVEGNVAQPIEIVHLATDPALAMGRVAIFVAAGASVRIDERVLLADGAVANTLTELVIGQGARVDWVRFSEGAASGSTDLSTLHTKLAERAVLEHLNVTTGLGLARAQVFCHVAGDEAQANFRAATVAIGERHADNTLVVRHNALHSGSSQLMRSAVGRGGTAIIQGRINVDPGAQKTDASMMSNALFLDETGEVVNKPELEIFADDVVCGHGATSGDLDEEGVFYLRARGIPEATARRLLVEAFLVEAIAALDDEALRERLSERLRHALDAMSDSLGGA